MGCCVSTEENRATQKHHQQFPCVSKSPPRAEEESVKEVLSETPQPWPKPNLLPEPGPKSQNNEDPEPEELQLPKPAKSKLLLTPKKPLLKEKHLSINALKSPDPTGLGLVCTTPEEISDVSEMCSLSEGISTATLREREEDEQHWSKDSGEVLQRVYRSQGQNGHFIHKNRAFSGGRSPARRSEPSPRRPRNPGSGPARRVDGQRRDNSVDSSARRSRSPATRSNVGRSPSARRTGSSSGRVRMVQAPERENGGKKVEEESERRTEDENENEWQGPNESLENPLVSLECFIFL